MTRSGRGLKVRLVHNALRMSPFSLPDPVLIARVIKRFIIVRVSLWGSDGIVEGVLTRNRFEMCSRRVARPRLRSAFTKFLQSAAPIIGPRCAENHIN